MDILSADMWVVVSLYVALGCAVGFCAGLLGVGGGVLLVPGLYYIEKNYGDGNFIISGLMPMALATSMTVIIPTGLSSSYAQIKRKAVNWQAIKAMTPGLVAGVCLGVVATTRLHSDALRIIFCIGLYCMALLIAAKKESRTGIPKLLSYYVSIPVGAFIGFIAPLMGIGGATLNVPYLNRAGIPLHNAIASSSVLGVIVALPSAVGFVVSGMVHGQAFQHLNLLAWCVIVPVSVCMAPLGVKASHALPVGKLKIIFACLLALLATKMAFDS